MRSNFDDVGDFHEKFGLHNVTHRDGGVQRVPDELLQFRIKFLREELQEFEDAIAMGDLPGAFDALLDLTYVAMGTAHLHGFPWQRGWDEVQRANMSKVRAASADESKRDSAWDVIKPHGWVPPNIAHVLTSPPKQCPQCRRYLTDVALKEVHSTTPIPHVIVYCVCGREVARREA